MGEENIRRAAQEYLAERLSDEGLTYEQTLNRDTAVALAPKVWGEVMEKVKAICQEWNAVTKEQTFSCKETVLGDLRIRCAGRPHQIMLHYESKLRLIRVENSAREEHEPKVALLIEGYVTQEGRGARLMRNNEPVNLEMLMIRQLRTLAGIGQNPLG
jgi:hypothetical protein